MTTYAKRFYKTARAVETDGGFGVMLDERKLRTPGGAIFVAPTHALALACAAEWDAQREHIAPASMPVTQLAFAAIDHTHKRRDELADYLVKFGETDLLCHRAETPAGLAQRQAEAGDPLLAWARDSYGVDLPVVAGVIAASVAPDTLARLRALALGFDDMRLTALAQAAGLSGSAVLALALTAGRIDADAAFAAATIDERWSAEHWGEDAEARARLDRTQREFSAIGAFLAALG